MGTVHVCVTVKGVYKTTRISVCAKKMVEVWVRKYVTPWPKPPPSYTYSLSRPGVLKRLGATSRNTHVLVMELPGRWSEPPVCPFETLMSGMLKCERDENTEGKNPRSLLPGLALCIPSYCKRQRQSINNQSQWREINNNIVVERLKHKSSF